MKDVCESLRYIPDKLDCADDWLRFLLTVGMINLSLDGMNLALSIGNTDKAADFKKKFDEVMATFSPDFKKRLPTTRIYRRRSSLLPPPARRAGGVSTFLY
jgi:hypothetical protein